MTIIAHVMPQHKHPWVAYVRCIWLDMDRTAVYQHPLSTIFFRKFVAEKVTPYGSS